MLTSLPAWDGDRLGSPWLARLAARLTWRAPLAAWPGLAVPMAWLALVGSIWFRLARSGRPARPGPGWLDLASTGSNFLLRTQGMSCFEYKECLAWNTRNVLLQTQGMSCFEHQECLAAYTRNVLLRTHGVSCFEHKECPACNATPGEGSYCFTYDLSLRIED